MMGPKRLVLLVEGDGDVEAAPILVKRLLAEYNAFETVFLDPKPFRVGEYSKLSNWKRIKDDFREWRRFLEAATKRPNCGGCLLILDGDSNLQVEGLPFCTMRAARRLAMEAIKVGAGTKFSTAIVFACMEFESWLIPCTNSFVGVPFSNGRKEIPKPANPLPTNPETDPRDAKGWFRKLMQSSYKPTRDQAELARLADLNQIRNYPGMRSFHRLESAIKQIIQAIRDGQHIVSPVE